jgi:hypothetical protein
MEHNYIIGVIPWPVAAATALWFGFMAWKSRKTVALWAIGGGVLGLVLSTLVLGLAQSMFIPFYTGQTHIFRVKVAVLAILVVFCVGWLFTGGLHRRMFASWKTKKAEPQGAPPSPPAAPAQPPAASTKS